jgi:peptidoglycan/xylan/chitin deacetylase (PgdA/CDA1 family)
MLKIVLIAEGAARRVVVLAHQIERHVPDAKICGIVYKVPASSGLPLTSRLHSVAGSVADWAADLLLGVIHGGRPRTAEMAGSDRDILARKCQQAGWDLFVAENLESPEMLNFIRGKEANLTVATVTDSVPRALVGLTSQGIVHGQICYPKKRGLQSPEGVKAATTVDACQVKITHLASQGETLLAKFDVSPDPLDTEVSLELKGSLILRDLLVQSIAAIAEHPERVADRVEAWIRRLIPSYLSRADAPEKNPSIDQSPPLQVRSNWKLCIYSLFLLSPSVIFRNWLRRWRRQHPVIFLNSHLVSDRQHRMSLPTEAFLRVVKYLQRHYRIVSLSKACELLKSGAIDEPTLVLTFDDGYEDNFVNLRAVSEETGVPVVVFVSTDVVENHREFPHDSERGLLGFRALTWDQVRYWSVTDAEFGSHTCSHYDCGSTDEASLTRELEESKRSLEEKLSKPVSALAFPFGKPRNMSAPAMAIAAKTYDHYLSSFGGENAPKAYDSHKHLLRKHLQGNAWESEFEVQDVFVIAKSPKRLIRIGYQNSHREAWDAAAAHADKVRVAGS